MEKPEDDSPLRAEGEVMMPLTRVPPASVFFLGWGQGNPVRKARGKRGRKCWEERWWLFGTRGSSCQRLCLYPDPDFSSEVPFPPQTPTLRSTHSHAELSLTTMVTSDPAPRLFLLPQAGWGRNYGKIRTKTKIKLLCREKGLGAASCLPSLEYKQLYLISFSPNEVAKGVDVEWPPQCGFNLQKLNILPHKPDQLKGDYSLYRQRLCLCTGFL